VFSANSSTPSPLKVRRAYAKFDLTCASAQFRAERIGWRIERERAGARSPISAILQVASSEEVLAMREPLEKGRAGTADRNEDDAVTPCRIKPGA